MVANQPAEFAIAGGPCHLLPWIDCGQAVLPHGSRCRAASEQSTLHHLTRARAYTSLVRCSSTHTPRRRPVGERYHEDPPYAPKAFITAPCAARSPSSVAAACRTAPLSLLSTSPADSSACATPSARLSRSNSSRSRITSVASSGSARHSGNDLVRLPRHASSGRAGARKLRQALQGGRHGRRCGTGSRRGAGHARRLAWPAGTGKGRTARTVPPQRGDPLAGRPGPLSVLGSRVNPL